MRSFDIVSEKRYAMEPTLSCGLAGGFLGCLGFQNSSFLVHGSSGCSFAMRYGLSQHWKSFIPCPVTGFHEQDVVFGGNELLRRGIEHIEKIKPSDILFVLTSCSSEIIGDDFQEIVSEESRKRGKIIIPIEVGGATGNIIDGYNNYLYIVANNLLNHFSAQEEKCSERHKSIDILGIIPYYDMFYRGDMFEIRRIFKSIGVNVNSFFSGECSIETMKKMFHSDMIISLIGNIGSKALTRINNRLGIPVKRLPVAPIGFKYTDDLIRTVCEQLELNRKQTEEILEQEELATREKMLRGFDFSKVMFTSGRVAIIGDSSRTIALANFLLNELGLRSTVIAFLNKVSEQELDELDAILKVRNNYAKVLCNEDNFLIRKTLLEANPNLVFGRSIDRMTDMQKVAHITWTFPSTNRYIVYDKPYLGFNGIISIVDDIINAFSNIWY